MLPQPSPFFTLLRDWNNFYFMLGGAAATLIGLLFVAVSLGVNLVSAETRGDVDTFVTPILLYFVSVLAISCAMLVPTPSALLVGSGAGIVGGAGLLRVMWVMQRMARDTQRAAINKNHWLWHALFPLLSYGLIVAGSFRLGRSHETAALLFPALGREGEAMMILALATVLLLLSGTWRA